MMHRIFACFMIVVSSIACCCIAEASEGKSYSHEDLLQMVYNMEKSYSPVNDYSAILIKQERIKDKLRDEETVKVYFKKPFNVYMEWIKDPYKGREAAFRKGIKDDKLLVRSRILWGDRTFAIKPDGRLAMMNNRHPVTEIGLGFLIETITKIAKKAEKNKEIKLVYHGEQMVHGRTAHKLEGILPKDKDRGYYCYRAILGVDKENGLPILFEAYMWDDQLYERYVYSELKLNPGVKDQVFESLD